MEKKIVRVSSKINNTASETKILEALIITKGE
jgi:hypothetical protein